jgi:lysophospholipase L1-like esterase
MTISRKFLLVYLSLIHLLLGLVLYKSDFIERARLHFGALKPEITIHYQTMLSHHRRMDDLVPAHAVIFIGDSITQSLAVATVAPNAVNYGIGSDTTLGVLNRLPLYRSLSRADVIVLQIGVNDLKRRGDEAIIANYKQILEHLPKQARVIVNAIHPVDEVFWGGGGANRRIKHINLGFRRLADQNESWIYCDAGKQLSGKEGNLQSDFHIGDGVHLNAKGYRIWIEALKAVIEPQASN